MAFIQAGFFILAVLFCANRFFHILQLEGYRIGNYYKWLNNNLKAYLPTLALLCVVSSAALVAAPHFFGADEVLLLDVAILLITLVAYVIAAVVYSRAMRKPLDYTHRVIRLFIALLAVSGLFAFGVCVVFPTVVFMHALSVLLTPFFVILACLVAQPFEKMIARGYFKKAQKKLLGMENTIKVGITGSFGKTSTKFILGTILAEKYKTYITPHSYNTPMGVSKVINNELTEDYEVFVSEMGARHIGDIAEMCELVHPTYGLITSIGPQHLETFKNIENIAKTKNELMTSLPAHGWAFYPDDDSICTDLYNKSGNSKKLFSVTNPQADVYAKDIQLGNAGCEFILCIKDVGEIACKTQLLGEYNIQNILGACAVALQLGLTPQEIASGVAKIAPVEHRMQILPTNNGITVIDDSYNSNPVGCKMAMEILSRFPGRHIVVTPGLVELGEAEYEENRAFGRAIAKAVSIAILVGEKRSKPIIRGLLDEHFNEENILVVQSLAEASERLAEISQIGDVVLFENDLPDNYIE